MACLSNTATLTAGDIPAAQVGIEFARVSPNPARGEAAIQFTLPAPTHVRIEVFDLVGRRVAKVLDGFQPAG
ncbi:MAG: hypothetical protein ABIS67_02090, partial [Candidatus Eisenbacteria bacterium]